MRLADTELAAAGLGLWGWDTEADSIGGWIGRQADAPFFGETARTLDVRIEAGGGTDF